MQTVENVLSVLAGISVIAVPYLRILKTHKNVLAILDNVEEILKNVSDGANNSN